MKRFCVPVVVLALALAGCAQSSPDAAAQTSVRVLNAYVRATGEPMTGAFMIIQNAGADEVALVSATSTAAPKVEIHEVVNGMMQPKAGGVVIAPGTEAELKPGGDHLMLMGLTSPVAVGDEVALTLTFSDGQTIDVLAPVKEVNAEQEHYHQP